MSFRTWHWNEDQIQLTWPAAAAGAESSTLYLPSFIDKVYTAYPGTTVGTGKVEIVSAMEMDRWRPAVGTVLRDYIVLWGYYGVENHLSADGVVTVNSSAGAPATQAPKSFYRFGHDCWLTSAVRPGDPGFHGVGRGADFDSSRETSKEHQRTELYAVASATATFTVRFYRKHFPFTRDQDIVRLPEQFDDLMELGLEEHIGMFRQQPEEVKFYRQAFMGRLREMSAWDNRQPGKKWRVQVRRRHGRLGRLSRRRASTGSVTTAGSPPPCGRVTQDFTGSDAERTSTPRG
jgi:hypothetical protein